jgi:hypothetical protein
MYSLRMSDQSVGGLAAGIANGSDFSRYSKGRRHYVIGTISSCVITGVLVSLMGLVTASASQTIYGEVYWNPPDLLMRMMENGNGSSKARAGVFFLAAGFAFTAMFENICGNAIAGGIDLAGLFPKYIGSCTLVVCREVHVLISALSRHTAWCNHHLHCSLGRSAMATNQPRYDIHHSSFVVLGLPCPNHWHHGMRLLCTEETECPFEPPL